MNRRIVDCRVGQRGCDTNTALSGAQAAALLELGFAWVTRYLSLGAPNPGDLTAAETAAILDAGLGLMAVQHVRYPGWQPSSALGAQDGAAAFRNAVTAGLPAGLPIWVDLEGTATTTTAGDVSGYVGAWAQAVKDAGYDPRAYIGSGLPANLDAQALWQLPVDGYWKSQSVVPSPANRGFQLVQLYPTVLVRDFAPDGPKAALDVVGALQIDVDVAQQDYRQGLARMLVAA